MPTPPKKIQADPPRPKPNSTYDYDIRLTFVLKYSAPISCEIFLRNHIACLYDVHNHSNSLVK